MQKSIAMNDLLWTSINCHHEGFDDLADDLLDCTPDDGFWWLYWEMLKSILKSLTSEIQCLVMAIILMVC